MYKGTIVYDENCDLPIIDEVDILVAGGGPAGVAAAETASRLGNNVLVIEKNGFFGGAAVGGDSATICGLFQGSKNPFKEDPKQIVYGFADKFYKEMQDNKGVTEPVVYGNNYLVPHDTYTWKKVAEKLVIDSGAKILFHTSIIGVIKDGETFLGVIIDTKSGIGQIRAKRIIDSTGDADIIYRAGYDYTKGDDGKIQNPTMIFRMSGVDIEKFKKDWGPDSISTSKIEDKMREFEKQGKYNLPRKQVWVFETPSPNEIIMNVTRVLGRDGRDLDVTDPIDHTEAEIMGREQVEAYANFFKDCIDGFQNAFIKETSCEVGIRQTRSIVGIDKLLDADVENMKKFDDGIVKSSWPIELHRGEKPKVHWLIDNYYEVPFGTLVPKKGENIIVAGRNLSSDHAALASSRVTAQCFEYGHAAAIAADYSIKNNILFRDIDGTIIRDLMNDDGAKLD